MHQMDHSMETLPTAVRREVLGLRRLLINDIINSNEVKPPHLRAHVDIILMSSVVAGQAVLFILEPLLYLCMGRAAPSCTSTFDY